jgi:hypothetical protein
VEYRWVVGIDPGLNGGIVAIRRRGIEYKTAMPRLKTGDKGQDLKAISEFFNDNKRRIGLVCLELVHSMPKQGVKSTFTFGRVFGQIEGIVAAHGLECTLVRPREWQKEVHKGFEGTPKERSLQAAKKLFPKEDFRKSNRARVPHDGIVDAALIALWGRMTLGLYADM